MRLEKQLMAEIHYNVIVEVVGCEERDCMGVRRTYKKILTMNDIYKEPP